MNPDQEQSKQEPEPKVELSKEELAAKEQQEQWQKAYLLQQRRMQCGRGGCGDGLETF